jgi:transcriptional regulator with GAF, ATPase, and Fis domain
METDHRMTRWVLAVLGGMAVGYCVLMLAIVATTPDLRLRFLLVDTVEQAADSPLWETSAGIEIRQTPGLVCMGVKPEEGDLLVSMEGQPITNFLDFARAQLALRNRVAPSIPRRETGHSIGTLPPLFQDEEGIRWIRIEYIHRESGERETCSVELQSVPSTEVGVTLVWFLLQLLIFSVGAIAFWSRPFDEAARRFFSMCTVTLGAFVGGFHWSMIAGSFWLTLPFAISGILLPAVTLHFFLGYPRTKGPLTWRRTIHTFLYAIPIIAIVCFLWIEGLIWSLSGPGQQVPPQLVLTWLNYLRYGVYAYLSISAGYFLLTIASLIHSVFTTRNPVELSQVRWILWAGFGAAVCIGYALVLAVVCRTDFALGGARIPMFMASLVFMLAYAIGIIRYKLMLIDQIISKGMWYYVLSYGATVTVALGIAVGTLTVAVGKVPAVEQPNWIIAGIVMLAVILLLWVRDSWQHFVDRRFFREKYQLDKALQRMQRDAGRLTDVQFLSERMSISCRDVLQSSRIGLYLSDGRPNGFRLTAADGKSTGLPMQLVLPEEVVQTLSEDPMLQRVTPTTREQLSPVQILLRQWQAELVHGLEIDGKLAGLVVLGPKQNGMMYSAEDLTFLTALAQITGIALHCAKVHQDITQLNEDLRLKTDLIGRQRQQISVLQAELATVARPDLTGAPTGLFRREAIIGHSPALEHIMDTVRKVAASETSVLVRGESGTGKELLARAIHENSPRQSGPLVSVHCAALSAGLLESELFGHVKGAFTGAHSDKPGRFELASGGTLFLDEIGDISHETQIKLLRVLQQREFERVGGTQTIQVDVRLIAATHQNLERLIADGKFREDLYYRLNVISVTLPPLRERFEDILELAVYFLRRAASRAGKRITKIEDEAIDVLTRYSWPGNIRELQNVIERAVVLAEGETVTVTDLPVDLQNSGNPALPIRQGSTHEPGPSRRDEDPLVERQSLIDALAKCGGNKARAARLLGLARSTYFSKLKKHGLADADGDVHQFKRLPR